MTTSYLFLFANTLPTCKAYTIDKPARPLSNLSRVTAAKRAAKRIAQFPIKSRRNPSHLYIKKKEKHSHKWTSPVTFFLAPVVVVILFPASLVVSLSMKF